MSVAGSLRRWEETVDVIDIVAGAKDPAALIEKFLQFPLILSSQIEDENTCVAHFADGAQVWLTVVPPEEFGITLFVKTGSQAHIEKVKDYAERKKVSFARLPRTEEQLYKRLGMAYIPPELREDQGEIEAALAKKTSRRSRNRSRHQRRGPLSHDLLRWHPHARSDGAWR